MYAFNLNVFFFFSHNPSLLKAMCLHGPKTELKKKHVLLLLILLSERTFPGVCSILYVWSITESRQQLDTQHTHMDFTLTFHSPIVVSARTIIH